MKKATILRYYSDTYCTLGLWTIEGLVDPVWHTIEPPWLNNESNVSCIPAGTYIVDPFHNPKYGKTPDCWRLRDVPNRGGVDIHVLNRAEQSKGCIGPGLSAGYMKYEKNPDIGKNNNGCGKAVLSSAAAMREIKSHIGYEEPFELTIIGNQLCTKK